jgi:hypothetical protein
MCALVGHNLRDGAQSIKGFGPDPRLHARPGVSIVSRSAFSYCPGLGSQRRPDPRYALQHAKSRCNFKGQLKSGAPIQLTET